MKYVDDFRSSVDCLALAKRINALCAGRALKIMEVCGTHTAAIRRFGLPSILSEKIRLISGPGCPVCVTSDSYLANALALARRKNMTLATYADMLRVPAAGTSLEGARGLGADIRVVTSALDVLKMAKALPARQVVFLAVGFETTAPGTALLAKAAKKEGLKNLRIYSGHKTIPQALMALGSDKGLKLDGFILPGHVSVITGLSAYKEVSRLTRLPSVVCGFEPMDILTGIYRIVEAVVLKKPILGNAYERVVRPQGNARARRILNEVFVSRDSVWRGLGVIPGSGLFFRHGYSFLDAALAFGLKESADKKSAALGCLCADVLKGKTAPARCPYFGRACSPLSPKGPCMVSREGSCRTHFECRV
ncbi:MAG: hydrogenase formation protein HypD [Candidatus Omnitrophota bacterium]